MTRSADLWWGLALGWVGALLALVLVRPPHPPSRPLPVALAAGAAAGLALYVVVERRLPPPPGLGACGRVCIAKHAVLAAWAGAEEIVWRWLVLGEVARVVGVAAALGVSSLGFALWHPSRRRLHLLTGLGFGAIFLAAGLAAAWAAHAVYNGAVSLGRQRPTPRPRGPG